MNSLWLLTFFSISVLGQKNPNFVENHSTIVHLFEWKWKDIAKECEDFLGPHGYGGVQISPPNENLILDKRQWYERYQPVSYVLETRSGNERDFEDMTRRCNKAGVRIYVDAIINHMSGGDGVGTAGNRATKYNFSGVPYTDEHFHRPCPLNNFDDVNEVRSCELLGLKDLDQGQEYVRNKIVDFMNHLIDLGVAGFRIDAARHMHPDDLKIIFGRLKNLNPKYGFQKDARAFIYQEVSGQGEDRQEYTSFGAVLEFRYGKLLSKVFSKRDKARYLDSWGPKWSLLDPGLDAVTFIDNHDTQRSESDILTYKNPKPYKMAVAFMLAHPYGTGRVMSSYDFVDSETCPPHDADGNLVSPGFRQDGTCTNGYICEHRWRQIYNMAAFRNIVDGTEVKNWQTLADHQIAFCRGDKGFAAFNNEGDIDRKLHVCLPKGEYCDVISGSLVDGKCTGKVLSVDENGEAHVSLKENEEDGVLAIHLKSKID
ncbi:alpha-amylase-like [Coccinella septempunctata]|uniref:alpha-amylase-like n=1 Tax=Coccinella septempunctata TaxID=41139 RepID=UPI001D070570|nr:alpha-amylase-like [Coccinella septempunctata]